MDVIESEMALYRAALSGNGKKVSMHISLGVSVEAENLNRKLFYSHKQLMIPLLAAAERGHLQCVQILIHHGANVSSKDKYHATALHLAAKKGHCLCVEALLQAGADYNICTINVPLKEGVSPYVAGTTALHLAAEYNKGKCVEILMDYGADYNVVDVRGHTSLYIAAKKGKKECVLTHLKNARGRDILSLPSYDTSDTPLHFAVDFGLVECVKELIHLGSDVNIVNRYGSSPLHNLCHTSVKDKDEFREIFRLLIYEGYNTDINICSENGVTPLYEAIFSSAATRIATSLIAYGADVNIKHKDKGFTLLEYMLPRYSKSLILKYIMNSMSCLPRLRSLAIDKVIGSDVHLSSIYGLDGSVLEAQNEITHTWHSQFLPDNLEFTLILGKSDAYVRIRNRGMSLFEAACKKYIITTIENRFSSFEQYYLKQPLLNLVYERLSQELKKLDDLLKSHSTNQNIDCIHNYLFALMLIKQCLWYERIASNARSLQHHCRVSIRKYILCHRKNLKYIKNLPLPESLQSYLLLDCDD